jgi:hypothetical protein
LALVLVGDVGALPGVAGIDEQRPRGGPRPELLDLLGQRDQAALGERASAALDGVGDVEVAVDVVRVKDLDPIGPERRAGDGPADGRGGRAGRRGGNAACRDDERREKKVERPAR